MADIFSKPDSRHERPRFDREHITQRYNEMWEGAFTLINTIARIDPEMVAAEEASAAITPKAQPLAEVPLVPKPQVAPEIASGVIEVAASQKTEAELMAEEARHLIEEIRSA